MLLNKLIFNLLLLLKTLYFWIFKKIRMCWSKKLISWYADNQRQLPWRSTKDPYKIWISEIILQQTRVEQGLEYYERFTEKFPDVFSLASAPQDKVLKTWQGLGYYSRARNLHETAKTIVSRYGGNFPSSYEGLLGLRGVGQYTAAAIASMCFNLPHPAVDGNVLRLVSRWFAIEQPVDTATGKNMITDAIKEIFDSEHPDIFNQAMMEFGALVCTPKNPQCGRCIFQTQCMAFSRNLVQRLPVKSKKINVSERYFHFLFIIFSEEGEAFTLLKKRGKNDIWEGLYDFPLIETPNRTGFDELTKSKQWHSIFPNDQPELVHISRTLKHMLTHQQLFAKFYLIAGNEILFEKIEAIKLNINDLSSYPMPRLMIKYLEEKDVVRRLLQKTGKISGNKI
jgi:A/G-specific adenine glycosylase